ncbi:MAG TPA: ABC transporter permease subunit/CPBP intramembrane protease [Phycisphaerae bacterium]|nr:CPBP family intramembrane metalloprotease [Phycisphaerales bacterium]HRX87476.1 ABC transporter permease subunit/CPBP intramembrane protease [Phycisphaerae bacterium]
MRPGRRIGTIYTKELIELLRDRRTLIAMIVVPIVLYPLLIIGSVHLLSIRGEEQKQSPIAIAVPGGDGNPAIADTRAFTEWAIEQTKATLEAELKKAEDRAAGDQAPPDARGRDEIAHELESVKQMSVDPVPDVRAAVANGSHRVGLEMRHDAPDKDSFEQLRVTPIYDRAEPASEAALHRVDTMLELIATQKQDRILAQLRIPRMVLEPVVINPENVASPKKIGGMVLGTIVPLVLVLMTITGAIYPAIDLTAGERERGTLETLIACPVPPVEVLTGKYLVVATVAMFGAALNLFSVGATLYFGGFTELLSQKGDTELPLGVLPIILLALIPFALLFSAVMVAVCSYARTFKEAQNYIMPVILAALIPGGIAALPGTELTHVNAVVPVMNMVLMARELLLGNYDWAAIALVLLSTTLYAGASVIIASRVFSTEAVVFADSVSIRAMFRRRHMVPAPAPSVSLVLLVTALLFPTWMFIQFGVQPGPGQSLVHTFAWTAAYMPIALVLVPLIIVAYFKVDVLKTFALRMARARFLLAGLLIGLSGWVLAHEIFVVQSRFIPVPQVLLETDTQLIDAFSAYSLIVPLLLISIVPALCEELMFRGFLFSGIRSSAGKWTTIIATACIFAVFHIMLIRFAITASLGVLLGYLRWQSRSLWPSILAHLLHNGVTIVLVFVPATSGALGIAESGPTDHMPVPLIAAACVMIVAGILLARRAEPAQPSVI